MGNKKGHSEFEKLISAGFGIIVIIMILTSGIIKEVFDAFDVFGAFSGILALLFILMIIVSIWEAFKRR